MGDIADYEIEHYPWQRRLGNYNVIGARNVWRISWTKARRIEWISFLMDHHHIRQADLLR